MIETISVPATHVLIQAMLSPYASGRTADCVLDGRDGVQERMRAGEHQRSCHVWLDSGRALTPALGRMADVFDTCDGFYGFGIFADIWFLSTFCRVASLAIMKAGVRALGW